MGCLSLITLNVMFVNNTVYFLLLIFSGANVHLYVPARLDAGAVLLPAPDARHIASARALIAGAPMSEDPAAAVPGDRDRLRLRLAGLLPVPVGRDLRQKTRHAGNDLSSPIS